MQKGVLRLNFRSSKENPRDVRPPPPYHARHHRFNVNFGLLPSPGLLPPRMPAGLRPGAVLLPGSVLLPAAVLPLMAG